LKIEKLSDSKIKLTVTFEDMERLGVNLEHFVTDTPQAREFFRQLMKQAETETGFRAENAHLMIEAMPAKSDGIVFFVTNLDTHVFRDRKPRVRAKAVTENKNIFIYEFEQFDDICDFVKTSAPLHKGGAVYSLDESYYLIADTEMSPLISEYGKKVTAEHITPIYLSEHGKCIIGKDAIGTIEKYFN